MIEKIEGTGLVRVNDALTEMNISSDARYSISCIYTIANEKEYAYTISSKPINEVFKEYIGISLAACVRAAYPNGIEFTEVQSSLPVVAQYIQEKVQSILFQQGIQLEEIQFTSFELVGKSIELLQKFREVKLGAITPPVFGNKQDRSEWVCDCGRVNTTPFCPDCGKPRN